MSDINPDVTVAGSPGEVARIAANLLAGAIGQKPDCVLGLATGRTMVGLYQELSGLLTSRKVDVSGVQTFNLDEYLGLAPDSPYAFRRFMNDRLFSPIGILPHQTRFPDVHAKDPNAACGLYEAAIEGAGGIDLQLLGIGTNGHIAFNERGSAFDSRTRVVELAPETRMNNAADFPASDAVPYRAMTMGIATILDARDILLLAIGPEKAHAVARALRGPISPDCPATALRRHHSVRIICDPLAAGQLT